jgi:iron complex transport system ATP-binding protein
MDIIEVGHLSFGYCDTEVLRDISFKVKRGSFLAIAGPNGAGKSTLLNLLCAALRPKSGSINIDAAPIEAYSSRSLARKVAVVRQEFVPVFGFSVIETVLMGRTPYSKRCLFESRIDRQIADEAMEATDTARFAARPLANLSGGERQRVFIARALAQDTDILLLDEPTSFLDIKHQVGIYDLLKAIQLQKGKTIAAVTHDINLAVRYADAALLLGPVQADSSGFWYGCPAEVFLPERIEAVFGVGIFSGEIGRQRFFMPVGKFAKFGNNQDSPQGPSVSSDFSNTWQKQNK